MNQPMKGSDWDGWSDQWRATHLPDAMLANLIQRATRARRSIAVLRVLSLSVTVFAVMIVAAALYHAANVFELALGFVVAFGICAAWLLDNANQRSAHAHADAPPTEYLAMRRTLCIRRIHFARLMWVLAALDLVFLLPWWIGGFKVHGFGFRLMNVATMWGPLALIIGTVIAAGRSRAAAAAELKSIDESSDL